MSDFKGNGIPMPEFQQESYTSLENDISIGSERFKGESPIAALLHDMIGDESAGVFPFSGGFLSLGDR